MTANKTLYSYWSTIYLYIKTRFKCNMSLVDWLHLQP